MDQRSKLQEENVAKVVDATSSDSFSTVSVFSSAENLFNRLAYLCHAR